MAIVTFLMTSSLGLILGMIGLIVGLSPLGALALYVCTSIGLGLLILTLSALAPMAPRAAQHG